MENKNNVSIIDLARKIGAAIQEDEKYIKCRALEQAVDSDKKLQDLIGEFNMMKISINNEMNKGDEGNREKIAELNEKFKSTYEKIMENENMRNYNEAKKEFDVILMRVSAIIMQSAAGEDPMTTDYNEGCSGSCGTCGGCH